MKATRTEQAIRALLDAIKNGEEFPDACPRIARKFRVSYEGLRDLYDALDVLGVDQDLNLPTYN
jgi:hypothetical protein